MTFQLKLIAAAAALATAFAAGMYLGTALGNAKVAKVQQAHAAFLQNITNQITADNQKLLAIKENMHVIKDHIEAGAAQAQQRDRADSAAARSSGERLRQRTADLAGRSCEVAQAADPAASSAAAPNPAGLLAELLGRVEEEGRRMAEIASERGTAGATCEQFVDAMNVGE